MNSIIRRCLVSSSIGSVLLSGVPIALALTPTSALAANNYSCEAFITYKDSGGHTGIQSLGPDTPVSGATITLAATACHLHARQLFQNNVAWYTPSLVCANSNGRNFTGPNITVWAIDRFKEISESPQRYNRVDSYVVNCGSVTWNHTLQGSVPAF